MKINSHFVLRQAIHTWIVVPIGVNNPVRNQLMTLNDSGAELWKLLEKGCEKQALVQALIEQYAVSEEQAQQDVDEFIDKLKQIGCLDE